jgi:hypothetical protein
MYTPSSRPGTRVAVALLAAIVLSSFPALAHHGWGGYLTQEFEISGTVSTPVSLAGPHATLKITANGQVWDVVLAPSNRTARAGLKEGIIPLGATVTAHGHRHQDPRRLEIKTERLTWNDRTFNVYPDRD